MRTRFVFSLALLTLPMLTASAQRLPVTPRPRVARPAELPPQPGPIAREMAYKRLPYSSETYPMISYHTFGFSSWLVGGIGEHVDLRVAPRLSLTLDGTSSMLGSPMQTNTVELGVRFRPDRDVRRLYPFADVRLGYMQAYQSQFRGFDVGDPFGAGAPGPGSRFSQGFGGLGGVGVEYALSRMFSLTSSAAIMRTRMTSRAFLTNTEDARFWMTTYRYTLGLRFNPVRAVHPPVPPYPSSATPKP